MSKFVVVDEILDQLEAVKSGVVPGSVTQSIVSGIQNVPSNIIQQGLAAGSGCYTTVPLSPIIKNCCLDKTYLNLEFDCNIHVKAAGVTEGGKLPFFIGFRDTSAIFNQLQILIENSALCTTVYHREESVVAYNSLPETEIRGNNQYSSIEKMRLNKYSPMKRIILTAGSGGDIDEDVLIHFKVTVDINRLTPTLSNLHYTTPHFGNLKLKLWIQRIQEAMFFCPDYSYAVRNQVKNGTSVTLDVINSVIVNPQASSYWSFYPLSTYFDKDIPKDHIPFYYTVVDNTNKAITTSIADSVTFSLTDSDPFMTFNGGVFEIVQTNFDIKEEEYARLNDYFASTGSIIIPTQIFDTGVFNNSNISAKANWNSTQIGSIGGYNVNFIATWSHPLSQTTCFNNERLQNIQLLLDGRPVNALPYSYVNDKCVVDCTQAIIDTDHEEINHDYINSLTFFNVSDTARYMDEAPSSYYNGDLLFTQVGCLSNPNTYMLCFSTNLPDAFHSGACILETSNRNGVLRLNSTSAIDTNTTIWQDNSAVYPFAMNHFSIANVCGADQNTSDSTVVGFTAFCDCCIVLTYDAARGICFDGMISWSSPYV